MWKCCWTPGPVTLGGGFQTEREEAVDILCHCKNVVVIVIVCIGSFDMLDNLEISFAVWLNYFYTTLISISYIVELAAIT